MRDMKDVEFETSELIAKEEKDMKKPIKAEMSKLVAEVLQRMIVKEIANQQEWLAHDIEQFGEGQSFREPLIEELNELAGNLEKQGIQRFHKI